MKISYNKSAPKHHYMVNAESPKEMELVYKIQNRVKKEEKVHVNGWKLKWIIWILEGLKEL